MCTYENQNIKWQEQNQQHYNHDFEYLYFMFVNHQICVVLWSSVRHIGG